MKSANEVNLDRSDHKDHRANQVHRARQETPVSVDPKDLEENKDYKVYLERTVNLDHPDRAVTKVLVESLAHVEKMVVLDRPANEESQVHQDQQVQLVKLGHKVSYS